MISRCDKHGYDCEFAMPVHGCCLTMCLQLRAPPRAFPVPSPCARSNLDLALGLRADVLAGADCGCSSDARAEKLVALSHLVPSPNNGAVHTAPSRKAKPL